MNDKVGYTELIHKQDLDILQVQNDIKTIRTNVRATHDDVKKLLTSWEGNGNIGYKTKIEKNIQAVNRVYWFLGVFTITVVLAVVLGG